MTERHKGTGSGGISGRPSSDRTGPAEAGPGNPGAGTPALDPELVEDLGAQPRVEDQLAEAREEAARNLATAQRWQAEFENFKKRQAALAEERALRAGERIVERLLPVIDDLDRAIDHAVGMGETDHLLQGVESVRAQLLSVLEKEGVEVIDPFGEAFDPNIHQAMSQRDDPELPEHTVVEVFQKGYRMHGRVLRPAMVVVSAGGPERAK